MRSILSSSGGKWRAPRCSSGRTCCRIPGSTRGSSSSPSTTTFSRASRSVPEAKLRETAVEIASRIAQAVAAGATPGGEERLRGIRDAGRLHRRPAGRPRDAPRRADGEGPEGDAGRIPPPGACEDARHDVAQGPSPHRPGPPRPADRRGDPAVRLPLLREIPLLLRDAVQGAPRPDPGGRGRGSATGRSPTSSTGTAPAGWR